MQHDNRRVTTLSMVDELVKERQQMWTLYCQFTSNDKLETSEPIETVLRDFCQILVDYISLGHFGIYQRIADGQERRKDVLDVADEVFPRLSELTDYAVKFNDKYEHYNSQSGMDALLKDLSELGENLVTRIELEDRLIVSMIS